MPRHPPCALKNLATKMLASTMQISNNKQQPGQTHHQTPTPTDVNRCDGRPVPQTRNNGAQLSLRETGEQTPRPPPNGDDLQGGPFPQDPTVCPDQLNP